MRETRTYELTLLVDSVAKSERQDELLEDLERFIEHSGGSVNDIQDWGNERLAYEINRKKSAQFYHVRFETATDFIGELEEAFEQISEVLRYLTIRETKLMRRSRRQDGVPAEGEREFIEYTDVSFLSEFTTQQGKILPRKITGIPAKTQRLVSEAIKRARHLAMMPYVDQKMVV